jgi:1-acyl-sn-glycerol-3-phosphate acyltransferase
LYIITDSAKHISYLTFTDPLMHKGYFDSYTYDTPVREKLSLWEKLLIDNRIYFTFKYAQSVLGTRRQALRKVYDSKAWSDSSFEIFKYIEKAGGMFHLSGMENIGKSPEPVLFISNHMSTLETMIFPCLIAPHREVTFVVKESLVNHPLFGDVMRSRNPVVVGRSDPRKDLEAVLKGGTELLSKGVSIVIFPQSTRSIDFKPEEFNSIGVKLAKKAGVKIVPVAIRTDFWGNGKWVKELGSIHSKNPIYIKFGEPFSVTGNGKEENQYIIGFIQSSLEEWK